MVIVP